MKISESQEERIECSDIGVGVIGMMLIQRFLVDTTLLFDFPEFERDKIVDCVVLISLATTWITVQGFYNVGKS